MKKARELIQLDHSIDERRTKDALRKDIQSLVMVPHEHWVEVVHHVTQVAVLILVNHAASVQIERVKGNCGSRDTINDAPYTYSHNPN